MQRKTTKKDKGIIFRQCPTDRMQPASDSVGMCQKKCHPIGWRETDRMVVTDVTSFAFMDVFTPHNHVWLIIFA
jgi:hypothetical protein